MTTFLSVRGWSDESVLQSALGCWVHISTCHPVSSCRDGKIYLELLWRQKHLFSQTNVSWKQTISNKTWSKNTSVSSVVFWDKALRWHLACGICSKTIGFLEAADYLRQVVLCQTWMCRRTQCTLWWQVGGSQTVSEGPAVPWPARHTLPAGHLVSHQ